MHARGQMALDLVLAMLVLLVILNAFSSVYAQFQATNNEISVRQQLRDQALLAGFLVGDSMNQVYASTPYPATATRPSGNGLPNVLNQFVRFTGKVPLSTVHAFNFPQGVSCTVALSPATGQLSFSVSQGDIGTPADVSGDARLAYRNNWSDHHVISAEGCVVPFEVRSLP